jgi:Zn-dependent peptidase ImmA (M78 family)
VSVRAPFLPYDKLRAEADKFLATFNPSGTIPVPIERIVEFDLHIDIVPTPGLHENFDIDSYPTSDLTEIHIDEVVYKRRPARYRFSLAHEVAHLVIHREIFAQLQFSTIDEWKTVVCSIPDDQYSWIEWQAYTLGGLILVPPAELKAAFDAAAARAEAAGVSLADASDETKRILESHIARHFDVSIDVVTRRMKSDSLWPE